MTTQLPDIVDYKNKDYDLAGISNDGLFQPKDYSMRPWGERDDCNRGYVASYAVVGQRLFLEELKINLEDDKPPLQIAVASIGDARFNSSYLDIHMPISYCGGLLIATGFIEALNSHKGFHSAWKYDEAHELKFERGRVTSATDVSELVRGFRKEMRGSPLQPNGATLKERASWADRYYSRRYKL